MENIGNIFYDKTQAVAKEVQTEVERASKIHLKMNSAHEAYAIIKEELEELWDEIKKNSKKMTEEQRTEWLKKMREEAIQTSAMCQRLIVDLLD